MSCFGPLWNATLLNYAAHPNVDVFISRYWKERKPHSYKIILNWDLPIGKGVVGVEWICEADFTTFFTTPDVIRTTLALSLLLVVVNAALVSPDSCLKAFPLTIYSLSCFPWREVWGRCISNSRLWIVVLVLMGVGSLRESPVWPWKLVTKEALFRCWCQMCETAHSLLLNKLQFVFTETFPVFLFLTIFYIYMIPKLPNISPIIIP